MKTLRRNFFLGLTFTMLGTIVYAASQSFKPKAGFVPDEKTAIAVGRAILNGIYGEKQIASEEPLTASLRGGIWAIKGTNTMPNGGAAEIEISKETSAVVRVYHGK